MNPVSIPQRYSGKTGIFVVGSGGVRQLPGMVAQTDPEYSISLLAVSTPDPMKKLSLFLLSLCWLQTTAQTDSLNAASEITAFQRKLNEEFKDRNESPLEAEDFNKFKGHDFFPIDLDYRVNAKMTVTDGTPYLAMKTTTSRVLTQRLYGYVTFTLVGKKFRMPVYQSKDLSQTAEYADYLFFPFSDETNGEETYGGGRYIDLRIPTEGDSLVIDFNMAYNPYCAYSPRFSCPLVPAENQMDIEVPVGVRYYKREKSETNEFVSLDSAIFTKVEVQPEYPGGYEALARFIGKHMTYPRKAVKQKIHGVVYVQFVVEPDGSISSIKTLKGISPECDSEAERVISLMPKWKPGHRDGKNVAVRFVLPISFKGRPTWDEN